MVEDENEKIRKWLNRYEEVGGFPVTLTLPLKTLENLNQFMKDKPFKSAGEAMMYLLDTHTEMGSNQQGKDNESGKRFSMDLEERNHS